jgi:hypothetical protein
VNERVSYVPEAVVDALVEAAWAFPGLRVSYSRTVGPRTVRHLASAGVRGPPDFTGEFLDLSGANTLVEAFRTADQAIGIEDVTSDPRTRPIADLLIAQGTRAYLIWPIRRPRDPLPLGWVALDSDRPRTWGTRESDALEQMDAMILMALEHAALSDALSAARTDVREHERRLAGLRGSSGSALEYADDLVGAMMRMVDESLPPPLKSRAGALGRQLSRVLGELDALHVGQRRPLPTPLDLNKVIAELAPSLPALVGANLVVSLRLSGRPLVVDAHRPGLERTIVNLLRHAYASAPGTALQLETRAVSSAAELVMHGDGLGADEALLQIGGQGELVGADELDRSLWRARCELLLHDASLTVTADGTLRILVPLIGPRRPVPAKGEQPWEQKPRMRPTATVPAASDPDES